MNQRLNQRVLRRRSLSYVWLTSLAAACAGVGIVGDAGAAPGDLRVLDPKTGLPKTWDSRVGRTPPPGRGVVKRAPGAVVDRCQNYDKTACADPTFTTKCPNAAPACRSWKELDACMASPPAGSTCGQTFYAAHKAELEAVPKARRVVPSRRSLGTETKPMGFTKFDPNRVKVGGMDHAFATRLANPATRNVVAASSGRAAKVTYMQAALKKLPKLAQLQASGDVSGLIDSCDEYGARKYMSLTQFDDDVSANQRDPRKTFDLVFSPKWASIVAKAEVKDSEGQVSVVAATASENKKGDIVVSGPTPLHFTAIKEPRNLFSQLALGFGRTFYDYDAIAKKTIATKLPFPSLDLPNYASNAVITAAFDDYQKKHEVFFNQEAFTRRPTTAKDSPTINETFDWHKAKNGAMWEADNDDRPGHWTDEELRIRYDRQQDLAALIAQRGQITSFIASVGSVCRQKTAPAPLPQENYNYLSTMQTRLASYAGQIKADPTIRFTQKYLTEIDPVLEQAGISKGWTYYDPIAKTSTTIHGPTTQNTTWSITYDTLISNGPLVYLGSSCQSQTGCTAQANEVKSGRVESRAAEVGVQIAQMKQYNDDLPKLNADIHQAFLREVNGAEVECKAFGIPKMFAGTGVPVDPNAWNPGIVPTLSSAEAQVVATALKTNILPKLEAVDALISEQLNSGAELGCFNSATNGCDWSPSRLVDFSHNYRKEIDMQREADVQRCQMYTTQGKGGFSYKAKLNDLMKSKGQDWNKSRKSVKAFEALLLEAEQEVLKQLKDEIAAIVAMQAYDEDGKTPALGQITSTDGSFGSDLFGAEYGAGGGFRFGSLSTDKNGNYSPKADATPNNFTYWAGNYAAASVKILGTTNEVFNARMDVALTDGHLLDLQQGMNATDKKYLSGEVSGGRNYLGEKGGIRDTFQKAHTAAAGDQKNRIVQGHLHFRVVQDDLFEPINATVQPTVYASTEPLYTFEPAEYDTTLFDESTTVVIVIVPVSIRGWATFHAGVKYSIDASLDRANINSLTQATPKPLDRTPFQLNNVIEPYASIDGNVSVALGVPGMEVGVKGSLNLIRMGLPYHSTATVQFLDGGGSTKKSAGNRFEADQGLDFTLSTLSGTVSGYVEILLWSAEAELFHWDGINSTTPIFSINEVDASVAQSSQAVRDLVASGFKLDQ